MRRVLVVGAAFAAAATGARLASRPSLVAWPRPARVAFPMIVGAASAAKAAALMGLVVAPRPTLRRIAYVGAAAIPTAAAAATAIAAARPRMLARLTAEGRAIESSFATPPPSPLVSGSAQSLVPMASVGREGARFVWSVVDAATIADVTGEPALTEPIRVFVGVDSAPTIEARVELAMAELRRTGAFDRAYLLVQAPAGSGFANSTPVDVLEILARGDVATVVIGYGVLPSFLSLGKVAVASRTQRLLLEAIDAELRGREARPRLLMYGESLGAKVQQAAVPDGARDLEDSGIDGGLWVGTPGGTASDEFHEGVAGGSITIDRPSQIDGRTARWWFLEHDGDPVVRFRRDLMLSRPAWLDPPHGRNVPTSMRWAPGLTWLIVGIDTMFATNVKPGDFQSLGHDYRADLGAVTTAAFGLAATPEQAARLDACLRRREVEEAARIAASSS